MASRGTIRTAIYCGYLAALFGFMVWLYAALTRFDGMLRLEDGKSEHLVFAPEEPGLADSLRLVLPPELHGFDLPTTARWLSSEQDFKTQPLPFRLSLEGTEVLKEYPPVHELEVTSHPKEIFEITAGGTVDLPSLGNCRVVSIAPWQGLLRDTHGVKSAALWYTPRNGARQLLLLEADQWLITDDGLALRLDWQDKPGSQPDPAALDEEINRAWWTVADGATEIRINQIVPGAGTECSDGSVWLVEGPLRKDDRLIGLRIRVQDKEKVQSLEVPVNGSALEGRVRLYHPASANTTMRIFASRDDAVDAAALLKDGSWTTLHPQLGEAVPLTQGSFVRIAQVLAYGLPALDAREAILQLNLEDEGGRQYYLRQGNAERFGQVNLLFREVVPRPEVRMNLSARWNKEREPEEFSLSPGQSRRIGTWRISQTPPIPGDDSGYLLNVQYVAFTPDRLVGIFLFIGGTFGLVLIRFMPLTVWKARRKPADEENGGGESPDDPMR